MESFRYWLGSAMESNGPATTLVGRTNVSTAVIGKRKVTEAPVRAGGGAAAQLGQGGEGTCFSPSWRFRCLQ
ncbi:unnamed protein product [Stenotrophomonas maltophilia]|nr:unnamed protein product [Stenotrophomonas maltophilia]